jgi:hypothetical protein
VTEVEELRDYSGEFNSDVKIENLSKEFLKRLFQATARLYVGLDGVWLGLIKERFGQDVALELSREVWIRAAPLEVRRVREAANIQGGDVASLFKYFQVDPGCAGEIWPEASYSLRDKNYGILTVKRCRSLEYFERHGQAAEQKHACEVLDGEGLNRTAQLFHPKMRAKALKLPPRQNKDDVACKWEFVIEE